MTNQTIQQVRQDMAEAGYEMTPEQVVEQTKQMFHHVRMGLRARGHRDIPDDDEGLLMLMIEVDEFKQRNGL